MTVLIVDNSLSDTGSSESALVSRQLERQSIEGVTVNLVNAFRSGRVWIHQERDSLNIWVNGKSQSYSQCVFLNPFRPDLLIFSDDTRYPHLEVHRLTQFFTDFVSCLKRSGTAFFPGPQHAILEGDSKTTLSYLAAKHRIKVPKYTANVCLVESLQRNPGSTFYKKSLGHPFVLTLDKQLAALRALTVVNKVEHWEHNDWIDGRYWQIQEPIEGHSFVRGFVARSGFAAASTTEIEVPYCDFRHERQVLGKEFVWHPYVMPSDLIEKVVALLGDLDLQWAVPEFVVNEKLELILIDLNPAGDWAGFFTQEANESISAEICRALTVGCQ